MYKAGESIYKEKVRSILFNRITRHVKGTNLRFLSLCNTQFNLEKRLLDRYQNSRFDCYEIDEETFVKADEIKPDNVNLWCSDIFKEDNIMPYKYSFVWLDLCNSYTDENINKIIEFTRRLNFTDRAIYAITLNKRRGRAEKDLIYNDYYPNYKDKGFVQHISPFINARVDEVNRFEYICKDISTQGAIMNLFTFKLLK